MHATFHSIGWLLKQTHMYTHLRPKLVSLRMRYCQWMVWCIQCVCVFHSLVPNSTQCTSVTLWTTRGLALTATSYCRSPDTRNTKRSECVAMTARMLQGSRARRCSMLSPSLATTSCVRANVFVIVWGWKTSSSHLWSTLVTTRSCWRHVW